MPPPAAGPKGWARRVALAGMVAPAGFFTVMMVLGLVTPGYDWVARYGSELSLGRLGAIMIANFIALGVAELALAAALGAAIGDRVSGRVATAAVIFFLATPIAALAMARRCRGQRGFARYCALTAVVTPALLIATFVSGSLLGLTERVVITVVLAWLTTLALQLRRGNLITR